MNNNRTISCKFYKFSNSKLTSGEVYHLTSDQSCELSAVLLELEQWIVDPLVTQYKILDAIQQGAFKNKKLVHWDKTIHTVNGTDYNPDSNIIKDLLNYILPVGIDPVRGFSDDIKADQVDKLNKALKKIYICCQHYLKNIKKYLINEFDQSNTDPTDPAFQNIWLLKNLLIKGSDLSRQWQFINTGFATVDDVKKRMHNKRVAAFEAGNMNALDYFCQEIKLTGQEWIDKEYKSILNAKRRFNDRFTAHNTIDKSFLFEKDAI